MTGHTAGWSGRSRLRQLFLSDAHERPLLLTNEKDDDTAGFYLSKRF